MLRLTATDQSITMTTSATGSVDYISDWTDIVNATAVTTVGSGQGNITTATTTTIISAPASGSSRAIKSVMISNRHGTTSNTIQLFKVVGASSYAIYKPLVLLAGETVRFSDEGFCFVGNACELEVTSATTAEQLESNATTGVMQIVGPAAGTTRVMTVPDSNFTVARNDVTETFAGRILIDDTTDATTTSDGSLQTDGGASIAKNLHVGGKAVLGTFGMATPALGVIGGTFSTLGSQHGLESYYSSVGKLATTEGIVGGITSFLNNSTIEVSAGINTGLVSGITISARNSANTPDTITAYVRNTVIFTVGLNGVNVASGNVYKVNGTQVLTARQAAIADSSAANATDLTTAITLVNELKTKLNTTLAMLRTHGLIAT